MAKSVNPLSKAAQQNAVKASSVMVEMDKLAKACQSFETKDLARTNQRLYQLLADVLAQYEVASAKEGVLKDTLLSMRKRIEATDGNRVQKNTLAISVFVRYAFNSDRQRIHNYTRAIQAAMSEGKTSKDLAAYITDAGGVDECKRKVVTSQKAADTKLKIEQSMPLVEESLDDDNKKPLATFSVPKAFVEDTYGKNFTFMVGKADASGKVKVLSVIPAYSKGMESWAKKALAKFLSDHQAASDTQAKSKAKDASIENAIQAASKSKSSRKQVVNVNATVGEVENA
jgi:hypothetical protein